MFAQGLTKVFRQWSILSLSFFLLFLFLFFACHLVVDSFLIFDFWRISQFSTYFSIFRFSIYLPKVWFFLFYYLIYIQAVDVFDPSIYSIPRNMSSSSLHNPSYIPSEWHSFSDPRGFWSRVVVGTGMGCHIGTRRKPVSAAGFLRVARDTVNEQSRSCFLL